MPPHDGIVSLCTHARSGYVVGFFATLRGVRPLGAWYTSLNSRVTPQCLHVPAVELRPGIPSIQWCEHALAGDSVVTALRSDGVAVVSAIRGAPSSAMRGFGACRRSSCPATACPCRYWRHRRAVVQQPSRDSSLPVASCVTAGFQRSKLHWSHASERCAATAPTAYSLGRGVCAEKTALSANRSSAVSFTYGVKRRLSDLSSVVPP
jgi:hypothetical protein